MKRHLNISFSLILLLTVISGRLSLYACMEMDTLHLMKPCCAEKASSHTAVEKSCCGEEVPAEETVMKSLCCEKMQQADSDFFSWRPFTVDSDQDEIDLKSYCWAPFTKSYKKLIVAGILGGKSPPGTLPHGPYSNPLYVTYCSFLC